MSPKSPVSASPSVMPTRRRTWLSSTGLRGKRFPNTSHLYSSCAALDKRRAKVWPRLPKSPGEIDFFADQVAEQFTRNLTDEIFLQHDNKNPTNRILIFAGKPGLKHLASSPRWQADGTFREAPQFFFQLYISRRRQQSSK